MLTETTFMPLIFLRPAWLSGIIAVLLISFLRYKSVKMKKQQGLIAPHLSENLVNPPGKSGRRRIAFPVLAILTCIALAGPSFRSLEVPLYAVEKAQVLALDLSYSMYATDLPPNRLSQQKYKAIDLIKAWQEGEKALISYAGEAFTIAPLTIDGNAIINHIPNLSPEIMPVTGSRPDLALEQAISLLKNAGYRQGHIVFFSDGITPALAEKMIKRLQGTPWVVSVLAIGTEQGAAIKLPDASLLKNQQGEIVVPKLDKQPLQALAQATGGLYLTLRNNNSDIKKLSSYFEKESARKKQTGQSEETRLSRDDGYWLAFLLLPLMLLLFRKGLFYLLLLPLTMPFFVPDAQASMWLNDRQNAFQAYQEQDYETAATLYKNPLEKGSALYKSKQYQDALAQFSQATLDQPDNADAFYNQGNTYAQLQEFDKAIDAYQQALTLSPEFKQALENKKLIEALKKQQQNSGQQSAEQQNSEQQNSEQQNSEQQSTEQQSAEQQSTEQQNSEQQSAEQQSSEQQSAEQQNTEQQGSEQSGAAMQEEQDQTNQELQALPNWLKNMPDDPSLLLRNKMRLEYQKRAQSQPVKQQKNGDIW